MPPDRRKLIAKVEEKSPALWEKYKAAHAAAESALAYVPFQGRWVSAYGPRGCEHVHAFRPSSRGSWCHRTAGSGCWFQAASRPMRRPSIFLPDLMDSKTLTALFDFENKRGLFEDVHRAFKFSVLLMNGKDVPPETARFVFFAHDTKDLSDRKRQISLTSKDLKLLNPNTRTCPIFRTRDDAELTKRVYRQVPILIDENRKSGGNPWGLRFATMFHQTNDAEHFLSGETLQANGWKLHGNRWVKQKNVCLPLYEAKMIQSFDHRAAGVRIEAGNWMRQGQTEDTVLVEHQNPEFVVQPRYWVSDDAVAPLMMNRQWSLAYKDVTSATNQRTMIAAFIPRAAVVNSAPLMLSDQPVRRQTCLLANLNALPYDFIARQKVGGLHLNFFIVEQLPTLPPRRI